MVTAVFLGTLFALLLLGVPIAFTLILTAAVILTFLHAFSPELIVQSVIFGGYSFTLLAIPFFILSGELMSTGGISKRIVDFFDVVVGHVPGGLGYVTILASIVFAGLSGSAVADAAALGAILLPMMVDAGYDKAISVGLIISAALIAPIIPPSIPMILYGVAGEVSIGKLFLSGIVPGLIMGLALMIVWYFVTKKNGFKPSRENRASLKEIWAIFKQSIWALIMPLIIVGGIRFGIFTPTEAGVIAVVYAFLVSVFIYKELTLKDFYHTLVKSGKTVGQVLLVATAAMATAWAVTLAQVPQNIAMMMSGFLENKLLLMFIINVFLLVVGMVIDLTPAMLILTPILLPLIKQAGIDPVYYGLIMCLNLVIGLVTPPVGTVLYVGCGLSKLSMHEIVKAALPFILVEVVLIVLFILFPSIVIVPLKLITGA